MCIFSCERLLRAVGSCASAQCSCASAQCSCASAQCSCASAQCSCASAQCSCASAQCSCARCAAHAQILMPTNRALLAILTLCVVSSAGEDSARQRLTQASCSYGLYLCSAAVGYGCCPVGTTCTTTSCLGGGGGGSSDSGYPGGSSSGPSGVSPDVTSTGASGPPYCSFAGYSTSGRGGTTRYPGCSGFCSSASQCTSCSPSSGTVKCDSAGVLQCDCTPESAAQNVRGEEEARRPPSAPSAPPLTRTRTHTLHAHPHTKQTATIVGVILGTGALLGLWIYCKCCRKKASAVADSRVAYAPPAPGAPQARACTPWCRCCGSGAAQTLPAL